MELNQFADACHSTNDYSAEAIERGALVAGLTGEAGEAAEQYKKMLRDDNCHWTPERREKAAYEAWDCLWYVNEFILSLGYTLEEVAQMGLSKLAKRKAEGKIHGEGSNR